MTTILKNIIITILLIIVAGLIIALIFYSDSPFSKEVPPAASKYATSSTVSEALKGGVQNEGVTNNIAFSKEDLTRFQSGRLFESGKANPFGNMSVQNFIEMPEEYISSGGVFVDNTLYDVDSEIEDNTSQTGASSSSSSSGRIVENQTSSSTAKSNSSTDNFYKSTGLK